MSNQKFKLGRVVSADSTVFKTGEKILAAISSGGDSLALFWWLQLSGFDFAAAHVHHDLHELRMGACDADENFVRQLCVRADVELFTRRLNLPRKNAHVNEVIARDARYGALLEMAREADTSIVATAHTSDDLLEGAILNLMRGAGVRGWNGFSPTRELGENIILVRPFWKVTRAQLRGFLASLNENWREDESNFNHSFARNRVRHEVLPLLSEISGREIGALAIGFAQNAQVARDEEALLEAMAREALEDVRIVRPLPINGKSQLEERAGAAQNVIALHADQFRALPVPIQRRILRLSALEIVPDARDISFHKVETVRLACEQRQRRKVWCWRSDLRVEWTGVACGNRIRLWHV